MTSINPDFSKPTCRVCLQSSQEKEMSSIFDLDADSPYLYIYEKIEQCAGIKVLPDDRLPTCICCNCYGVLKISYDFRITCRNSEEFLKNILEHEEKIPKIEESFEQNPLSISETSANKKNINCTSNITLRIRQSRTPQEIKNYQDISTNFEEFIDENFDNDDDNLISFDNEYHDENYLSCDEDVTDSKEKVNIINIMKEIEEPKKTKRKKILVAKGKKSTKASSKTQLNSSDVIIMNCDNDYHDEKYSICDEDLKEGKTNLEIVTKVEEPNRNKKTNSKKVSKDRKPTKALSKTIRNSSDGVAIKRGRKPRVKKEKQEKRPHICEVCGNIFKHRYSLELHIKRHNKEKPFECEICGYRCHSNIELIRHMRKHTGSRPYKCSYCPRAFGDQSTLIKHERVHRNERPFKCDICGKSFSYTGVLNCHKLIHTGEKPYKCEICGKCFNTRHHLRSHLKTVQHQNDPRVETLLKNIRKNNEDETLKVNSLAL